MTTKDLKIAPGARKTWSLDWADPDDPFLRTGESIAGYAVAVSAGLTKLSDSRDGSVVFAEVEAATGLREGQRASILITITTDSTPSRRDTRRIPLTCKYGEIA